MQYHEKLPSFIKNKREALGMSLNSFCYKNGIEPATLSRIENLRQEMKMGTFVKIATGLNQTPAELLVEFEKTL